MDKTTSLNKCARLRVNGFFWMLILALLGACAPKPLELDENQAGDLAWQALRPNTSSGDRAAWQISLIEQVSGAEIAENFNAEPAAGGCVPGPALPANREIAAQGTYWYVQFQPVPATPEPVDAETISPTAPPRIPEPFLYRADLLIEADSGKVIARRLYCVIY
ncbi:hypothetical protein BECAL_00410 [Bellilinea caldifistulae]|nr:hypothetical protein [Bellilinea caldifistulae]GAP09269.1 hypothetical protein BECAL_00410 [Bellilinea caldifistulae]